MTNPPSSVSPYVASQFPEFVRENHPRFLEFMKAYYQWMESQNNVLFDAKRLLEHQDIDTSEGQYLEQLFREFLTNIPRNVLADRPTLLKNIKQFYRARGTEKSYKFFFRFLYNLNVEFYYPRTDILKVSDGKWIQQKVLRVFALEGDASGLRSQRIRGVQNGSTAYVERVVLILEGDFIGYELILNNSSITGEFSPEEIVETEGGAIQARISAVPLSVDVGSPGSGYTAGLKFQVNEVGYGAEIEITSVTPTGGIESAHVNRYGLGYQSAIPLQNYPLNENVPNIATVNVNFGALIEYPGYYLNEDGQLSTLKYLHDGDFYQQFSYVLFVDDTISVYRDLVRQLLHPAGLRLFGGFRSSNVFDSAVAFAGGSNASNVHLRLNADSADASATLYTQLSSQHQTRRSPNTFPLGPSRRSVYRERFNYKPVAKYDANSEILGVPNYFGTSGDLSAQKAITPISVFDGAGLTPYNVEEESYAPIKILPDAVIKTET